MVHKRAIGAVQRHPHWLSPCWRAAGALVLHFFNINGVHSFAGTFALQGWRGVRITMLQQLQVGSALQHHEPDLPHPAISTTKQN